VKRFAFLVVLAGLACAPSASAIPTVNFDISPWPGKTSQLMMFTARVTCDWAPCTYRWYHGTTSSTQEFATSVPQPRTRVQHTYTAAGQKMVTLKVRNRIGQTGQWSRAFPVEASAPAPPPPLPPNPQCSDGVDNADPEDSLVDLADPGCSSPSDNDETNAPPPSSSGVRYGFHQGLGYFGDNSFWSPRLDATASIGSQVSRGTMLWDVVEPQNDAFNFSRYDALVAQIKQRNMVPVFDLGRAPSWANGSSDGWVVPADQTAFDNLVNEYAEFAGRVAARYAGQELLYEIWNEPNERFFWKGSAPSVDRYAQMFTAARNAMLQADPTAKVGLGGITGLGASCCLQGINFIAGLVDRGVQFDYAGIHAYDSGLNSSPDTHNSNEQNFDDILAVENVLNSMGRPNVKLWLTEWGWYGCSPDNSTRAAWLKRGHERIRDQWSSFVQISTYFMDKDEPAYPCAGVFTSSLQRKPLADAFEQFMATVP
jgi:Glycosyl hydrolases family 39